MNFKNYILLFIIPLIFALYITGPENCNNEIDDDGDGLIDCYDPDCGCEEICLENYYKECEYKCSYEDSSEVFNFKIKWQSRDILSNHGQLVAGDLNNDGIPEIIARTQTTTNQSRPTYYSSGIKIFSRLSNGDYRSTTINERISGNGGSMAIADIERDQNPELIFIGTDGKIHIYSDFTGSKITKKLVSTTRVNIRSSINIADFNEDGIPEIYVGNEVFSFTNNFTKLTSQLKSRNVSGKKYIKDYSGGLELVASAAVDIMSRKDCGGDPDCDGLELVCGPVVYSIDLSTTDGDGIQIKVQFDARQIGKNSFFDGPVGIADMDMDGLLDVIVNGSWDIRGQQKYGTYIYSPVLKKILLVQECPSPHPSIGALGMVTIANVIDDIKLGYSIDMPEVILVGQDLMYCISMNKSNNGTADAVIWQQRIKDNSAYTGCTVFDFNGDGLHEIVYRDENDVRIIYGGIAPFPSGVDAQRNWAKVRGGSATGNEYPLILDVDNDGHSEIVVNAGSGLSLNGNLRIYESTNHPWLPSRPLWNQQQYFNVNINDDLTIPKVQQKHHWVGDNLVLNTFLNQYGDKEYPLADGNIEILSYSCISNGVSIKIRVCNTGDTELPANTPINIYDKDPLNQKSNLVTSITLGTNLPIDSCVDIIVPILGILNGEMFFVLNVNATQQTPINIAKDFPITNILECDYYNNFDSTIVHTNNLKLDIGPDKLLCIFENITLDPGSGHKSYLWQDGSIDQTFFVSEEGLYWVEVEDQCGNIIRDSVEYNIKKPPPLPHISDTTICYGQEIIFTIDNNDFHYFEWSSDGGFECKDCPTISDFPEQSSTYILSAQTVDGCERFDTFYVEVLYPFHTFDSISICKGDTIEVFGQSVWMEDDFQNLLTSSNGCDSTHHIHVKQLTGQFTESNLTICPGDSALIFNQWRFVEGPLIQKYNTNNFCDSISLIRLNFSPPISGSIPMEYFICEVQDEVEINANFSGGTGELSYFWDNNSGKSSITLGIGKHELLIEDEMGCSFLLVFEIFLLDKPDYTLDHTDVLCFGFNDGTISINQLNSQRQWQYSLGNLNFSRQPPYSRLKSGQYILYARDSFGCLYADTINIISPDSLTLTISNDTTIILGNSVALFSNGNYQSNEVIYNWSPSEGLSCTDCPNPIARPLKTTTYTLTITDKNGCPVTRELTIFVKIDFKVYVPNLFSPNGDGINDGFTVFTNKNIKEIEYLEIYDRWGELVFRKRNFEPNDPKKGWDGKLNDEEMNPAVFVYVAGVRFLDDSVYSYHGDVTLVR